MTIRGFLFKLGFIPFLVQMKYLFEKLIEVYDILIGNKFSKRKIRKILSKHYKNKKINVISKIDSYQQQVFFFSLKNDNKIIEGYFKTYIGNASWWSANLDNLYKRELTSLELLNQSNCPVPKIIINEEEKIPWIITKNIKGETLLALASKKELKINPTKLAQLLYKIHSTDISFLVKEKSLTCFDEYYIENELSKIALFCNIDNIFITELIQIANKCKESSDLVFCHGDFHLGNILLDYNNNLSTIDFEESVIGYRQYDLGEIGYHLIKLYGEEFYEIFLAAYMRISKCSFDKNLYRDIHDFIDIRNKIIGIFLLNGGYKHKLPYSVSFIRNENTARKELYSILDKRKNIKL
ncbi:aminoglycoside phosphotransferase family protein [Thalassobellus sediminis]|uniref:aminoglycoside phosphotransferase family protein n=1 Tax=Thalassobellus sediminis TaxID=3367753 RepID=UPI0037ACE1F3